MNQTSKTRKPKVVIMVGPPCSGKSTWADDYCLSRKLRGMEVPVIISRDKIRETLFGEDTNYSHFQEVQVNSMEDSRIDFAISRGQDILWDNTHCRVKYLNATLKRFENEEYFVEVQFLNAPYNKLRRRNFWRYLKTGRWIPRKVTKQFQKGYEDVIMHWFGGSSLEPHILHFFQGQRIPTYIKQSRLP